MFKDPLSPFPRVILVLSSSQFWSPYSLPIYWSWTSGYVVPPKVCFYLVDPLDVNNSLVRSISVIVSGSLFSSFRRPPCTQIQSHSLDSTSLNQQSYVVQEVRCPLPRWSFRVTHASLLRVPVVSPSTPLGMFPPPFWASPPLSQNLLSVHDGSSLT